MPTPLTIISSTYSQIVLLGPNIGPLTTRSYLLTPLCYFANLTAQDSVAADTEEEDDGAADTIGKPALTLIRSD